MSGKHPLEALAECNNPVGRKGEDEFTMPRACQLEIKVTPRIDLTDKTLTSLELEAAWKKAPAKVRARVNILQLTQQASDGQLCDAELEQAIRGLATSRKTLLREKKPYTPGWEPLEAMGGAILAEPLESAREKQAELQPLAELMRFFTAMQVIHIPDTVDAAADAIKLTAKSKHWNKDFTSAAKHLAQHPELLRIGTELLAGYKNYFSHQDRKPAAMAAVALNYLGWSTVSRSDDYNQASRLVRSENQPSYKPAMLVRAKRTASEFQPEALAPEELAAASDYYERMVALYARASQTEDNPIWQAAGTLEKYQNLFPDCDRAAIVHLNQSPEPLSVTTATGVVSKELLRLKPEVTVKLNELTGLSALMHGLGETIAPEK